MGLNPFATRRRRLVAGTVAALVLGFTATTPAWGNSWWGGSSAPHHHPAPPPAASPARSPIQHVVVIFDENISFDHYFGTYPKAANTDGTRFVAAPHTPAVNGLTPQLLKHNPNAYNPARLTHEQALTCDQDHSYANEQKAYDGAKADKFVEFTDHDTCTGQPILYGRPGLVMDYFDGNTVTGLWNYAQHFALSDNSYDSTYGPSSPGAINLISGNTHGIHAVDSKTGAPVTDSYTVAAPDAHGVGTMINDPDPAYDDCSDSNHTATSALGVFSGRNVGDLLNAQHATWGWFQGGFRPTGTANGYAVCGATHANIGGNAVIDYSPHHNPFSYYASTSNPKHLPPTSVAAIGHTDRANHNYDLTDFDAALAAGNLPAVSYLKAAAYQDGHAGYSDPLDEQAFLVREINQIQRSPQWASTAVVIAYDDSDGWYDHVAPPLVNGSHDPATDQPRCLSRPAAGGYSDRCGYGPRLPMLVISPYSRAGHVDHSLLDQTSVLRFIEDNWGLGRIGDHSYDARAGSLNGLLDLRARPNLRPVLLDGKSGAVVHEGQ
ncbi:MAG TPA: alkaline phosphatase family protein [Actinoplanes sp.]|jgi:phospholipase C